MRGQEVCARVCFRPQLQRGSPQIFNSAPRNTQVFLTENYDFLVIVRLAVLLQPENVK